MNSLAVAVVGCGSFGRNHARVYASMPGAKLAGVYDSDPARARALADEFQTAAFESLAAVVRQAQAATLATPTQTHAEVGVQLLEAGVDLLVEKPIAPSLLDADRLIDAAARCGRILQVGHLERFNPAVRLVRPHVTRPMFFEVHRLSIFTPRSLDVDVLLDLMIHDLDLVASLVKSPVEEVRALGLPVLTPHVDIANVRLGFANGCVANLTASRVSTERVRKLRFFQPGAYVSLDFSRQDAHVFAVQRPGEGPAAATGRHQAHPEAPLLPDGVIIGHQHLTSAREEPLRLELEAFLACVRERSQPQMGGEAARAALELALQAGQAIREHAARLG